MKPIYLNTPSFKKNCNYRRSNQAELIPNRQSMAQEFEQVGSQFQYILNKSPSHSVSCTTTKHLKNPKILNC